MPPHPCRGSSVPLPAARMRVQVGARAVVAVRRRSPHCSLLQTRAPSPPPPRLPPTAAPASAAGGGTAEGLPCVQQGHHWHYPCVPPPAVVEVEVRHAHPSQIETAGAPWGHRVSQCCLSRKKPRPHAPYQEKRGGEMGGEVRNYYTPTPAEPTDTHRRSSSMRLVSSLSSKCRPRPCTTTTPPSASAAARARARDAREGAV